MKPLLPIGKQISLILCDLHIMHICMGIWAAFEMHNMSLQLYSVANWCTIAKQLGPKLNRIRNKTHVFDVCNLLYEWLCVSVTAHIICTGWFHYIEHLSDCRVWSGPFHWWRGSHPHSGRCTACGWADPHGPSLDWSSQPPGESGSCPLPMSPCPWKERRRWWDPCSPENTPY